MATQSVIAGTMQQAEKDLVGALTRMSEVLGDVDPARFTWVSYPRDPQYQRAMQWKSMAEWAWALSAQLDTVLFALSTPPILVAEQLERPDDSDPGDLAGGFMDESESDVSDDESPVNPQSEIPVGNLPSAEIEKTGKEAEEPPVGLEEGDLANAADAPDLAHMTKAELIALAASYGIDFDVTMHKAEMIDALAASLTQPDLEESDRIDPI